MAVLRLRPPVPSRRGDGAAWAPPEPDRPGERAYLASPVSSEILGSPGRPGTEREGQVNLFGLRVGLEGPVIAYRFGGTTGGV